MKEFFLILYFHIFLFILQHDRLMIDGHKYILIDLDSGVASWASECADVALDVGSEEYTNLVLDDAEDSHSKTKSGKPLGRIC